MQVLIHPSAQQILDTTESEWIRRMVNENEKTISDSVTFAIGHPEATLEISIGRSKKGIEYLINVYEIDPDEFDIYQLTQEAPKTNYSADVMRFENGKRTLIGRIYL